MSGRYFQNSILVIALATISSACTPQQFQSIASVAPSKSDTATPTDPTPAPMPTATPAPVKKVAESFTQDDSANKVDILVIDDNSSSMEVEQKKMADRFPSFISALGGLDYQISVTTTDIDSTITPKFNLDGRVIPWEGTTSKVLTPATPDAASVFKNTIKRSETIGCTKTGVCPSGNEQPLGAVIRAIDQRFTANAGIFRDSVDLAVIVLSDEDELSDGPVKATKPNDVINRFQAYFGNTKRLRAFGLIIQPGDAKCLKEQRAQTGTDTSGYYGTHVDELARLTGGSTNSICLSDYSKSLADISQSVRRLVGTFELANVPKLGSVKVILTPASTKAIPWHIEGKNLIFDTPPAAGTRIDVTYE